MNKTVILILTGIVYSTSFHLAASDNADPFVPPERGFTSWQPASSWDHALLAGNGIMGAMVMGQPHDETIILNHAQLYMPSVPPMKPIDQSSRLPEIRRLIEEGRYEDAGKIPVEISLKEGYGGLRWTDPYMPAFDIRVIMDPSNVKRYLRKVDFSKGETSVCWEEAGGIYQKKLFVSRADNVVVLSIRGSGKINCSFEFVRRPVEWVQWTFINENIADVSSNAMGNWLTYRTEFKKRWQGSLQGFEGVGRITHRGGVLSTESNRIAVRDANEVMLLVRIEPSYDMAESKTDLIKGALEAIPVDYDTLLERHAKLHGGLFNRMRLDLGGSKEDSWLYTEEMNLKAKQSVSAAFIEKQFDAARYNVISATGINPPNLQGIWGGSWTPPWSSDFTQDGNLEVAVSSMMSANLPELMMSLFDYEDRLLSYYRDNAKYLYGCRGIQVPSRTSTHGWNVHFSEGWPLSFWNAGAGWIAGYYYDYYLYTGDKRFLADRAYPFMKEAALFYEDFLIEGKDGKYVFNPSYSPENNPLGNVSQTCINATMDVSVAKQLLRDCMTVGLMLGEDRRTISKWRAMLAKMPAYEVNEDGAFREWLWPGLKDNYAHRHVSHLIGLFDRIDPEIAADPKLISGCKKAIEERMKVRRKENGGVMVFGMVDLALAAVSMNERDMVGEIIEWLSSWYWSNSLATYHDPGGLFNMDLSGGFPGVVIRALAYSEPGLIVLLPALPPAWHKGKIEGILMRGQVEVKSLAWNGKNIDVVFNSRLQQKIQLKVPGMIHDISGDGNVKIMNKREASGRCLLVLPENKDAAVRIVLK